MLSIIKALFNKSDTLAKILAEVSNREELLGMKPPIIPTPEGIKIDAAKIAGYADTDGYKKFAEEAWAQIIQGLDKILDPKADKDTRNFYCGEVNATLNLLRLSYKARIVLEQDSQERNVSLRHIRQG